MRFTCWGARAIDLRGGAGQQPIVEPTTPAGGSVVLSRGGAGPTVVVPCATTRRGWLSEVDIGGFGVAGAHLPTTVSVDRVIEVTGTNIGPVTL